MLLLYFTAVVWTLVWETPWEKHCTKSNWWENPDFTPFDTKHKKTQDSSTESPSSASKSKQLHSSLWSLLVLWSLVLQDFKRVEVMPCSSPTYSSNIWAAPNCSIMEQNRLSSSSSAGSKSSDQPDSKVSSCLEWSILPAPWHNSIPINFPDKGEGKKENKESHTGCHLISCYLNDSPTELHEKLPACCWSRIQLPDSKEPLFWCPEWRQHPVCNAGTETGSQPNNRLLGLCSHLREDDLPPTALDSQHMKHVALGHFTPTAQHCAFNCQWSHNLPLGLQAWHGIAPCLRSPA